MAGCIHLWWLLPCAFLVLSCTGEVSGNLVPVSTDRLLSHLKTAFSHRRSYKALPQKDSTRQHIKNFLDNLALNYSTSLVQQRFQMDPQFVKDSCVGDECSGINYLWILPGSRFGTPQDKIHILGAHYDTTEYGTGVDDNGSGMAALLEAARVLSQTQLDCERLNSVAFVAFDWDENKVKAGSKMFLENIHNWDENHNITEDNIAGAVILDSIMNWNYSKNTQRQITKDDRSLLRDVYDKLKDNRHRGNFLSIVQRVDEDDMGENLYNVWKSLSGYRYDALRTRMYKTGSMSSWDSKYTKDLEPLLRSSHTSFWNFTTSDKRGLKAVFLTDTADRRGVMIKCHLEICDSIKRVTREKVEFLAKTTEMLVRYYVQETTEKPIAQCGGKPQKKWKDSGSPGLGGSFLMFIVIGIFRMM